jgi:DNA primase large subunit
LIFSLNFYFLAEKENKYAKQVITIGDKLKPEDIEGLNRRSFPLCMDIIHRDLTKNSHLKYEGRLQYGLFLKGIGLSLEDSLNFWKKKFSKLTNEEKFEKDYAYGIRYNYGQEGKRANFSPYSCNKIQNLKAQSVGETHGCPFKTMSNEKLKEFLSQEKFNDIDVMQILEKKSNYEFSAACIRYYKAKHKNDENDQEIGLRPNSYYNSSIKYYDKNNKNKEKPKIAYENNKDKDYKKKIEEKEIKMDII